jgi:transposase-like protein
MPRAYPDELRARAVSWIRFGHPVKQAAPGLDVSYAILLRWIERDKVDKGGIPGVPLAESPRCVRHENVFLGRKNEIGNLRREHEMLGSNSRPPPGFTQIN